MLFHFTLRPLEEVVPWGEPGKQSLHWFGLTDGMYWMEVGDEELFRYSDRICEIKRWPRYCDYQVVRLYEDVVGMLPDVLEPVPSSLAPYLHGDRALAWQRIASKWLDRRDDGPCDEQHWNLYDAAAGWIGARTLDTNYLSPSANIRMWSEHESVIIAWDNTGKAVDDIPAWSATLGAHRIARDVFAQEAQSFHSRLMEAMEERVGQVVAGALPSTVSVDLNALQREHEQRSRGIERSLAGHLVPTDWDSVRSAIAQIEGEVRRDDA